MYKEEETMKKLSALLLASLFLCPLCGCKENEQNNAESQTTTTLFETNGTIDTQTTTQTTESFTILTDSVTTTTTTTTTAKAMTTSTTTTSKSTTEQGGGTKRTTTTTTTKATTTTTANPVPSILNPKTNIKMEEEYVSENYKVYDDDNISAGGISFFNDAVDGEYALVLEAMFEPQNPGDRKGITHNGKTYYRCGAGQTPHKMEMTDTEIIIKKSLWESDDAVTIKMVLQNDGNLKVTYSKNDLFAVGDILSISYNGLK